jgi:hypothetical protein
MRLKDAAFIYGFRISIVSLSRKKPLLLIPTRYVTKLRNTLVPMLQLGNPDNEAPASRDGKLEIPTPSSQAEAWELAYEPRPGNHFY